MPASRTQKWKNQATRQLAWFHRWLGVATCLVFALWFASGAVLLLKPFPTLPRAEQLQREAPIDLAAVRITPLDAAKAAGGAVNALRLVQRGNAPAFIASTASGTVAVDARTAERLAPLSSTEAEEAARRQIGATAQVDAPADYDQWIVHNEFDPYRPFFRIRAQDEAGTHYYMSARTGELLQRTDTADRGWNWVGAVLHWAYFTPLRSSFTAWDQTVWWLSLVAMLVAIAGIVLGVIRTLTALRQRKPSLTFFRLKWMRWHHLTGLFASLFVLSWIVSGWLSMDHGRLFSRGAASTAQLERYAGRPFTAGLAMIDPAAIKGTAGAREITFTIVGGSPVITAWNAHGPARRYAGSGGVLNDDTFAHLAMQGVAAAWPGPPPSTPAIVADTDFYAHAEGWPTGALRVVDPTGHRPDIAIDGTDGHLLTVMNGSRKAYAWVYYGLHSFNVPGLVEHQLLRDIAVLIPLLLGFIFSITGVVLGYQRLRKSF